MYEIRYSIKKIESSEKRKTRLKSKHRHKRRLACKAKINGHRGLTDKVIMIADSTISVEKSFFENIPTAPKGMKIQIESIEKVEAEK